MAGVAPPSGFSATTLDLTTVDAGSLFGRIYLSRYPDALGFGKSLSRFSDPRRRVPENRFGVLYLGSTLKVCFVESVLRDQGDGRIGDLLLEQRELAVRNYAMIAIIAPLSLVDLRSDGPLRMGIPSDVVRGAKQSLARRWSLAFHEHPAQPDGIIYPSRLNGEINLAIYDRAIGKLGTRSSGPLLTERNLAGALRDLKIGLH